MNNVQLIGRLTRDPEMRYGQNSVVCLFPLAINRGKDRNGNDLGADFPNIKVFGKQAENCGKHLAKGLMVGVQGRIQTSSYTNRNGEKVYTTDVIADRVEFLEWKEKNTSEEQYGFQPVDDDIAF